LRPDSHKQVHYPKAASGHNEFRRNATFANCIAMLCPVFSVPYRPGRRTRESERGRVVKDAEGCLGAALVQATDKKDADVHEKIHSMYMRQEAKKMAA
jgi:hypothetical protein